MEYPVVLADPKERAAERDSDSSWIDYVITKVEPDGDDPDTFFVTVGDGLVAGRPGFGGWTTAMPWPIEPKPLRGHKVRVWSNGSQNHGVSLWLTPAVLVPVYYRTKRERDAEWGWRVVNGQIRQHEEFDANRVRMDAAYEALPEPLKRRIERFRAEDPDFRWKEEAYEMAACSEAGRLYTAVMDPATGKILKDAGIKLPKDPSLPSYEQLRGEGSTDWEDTPENRLRAIDAINGPPNNYNFELLGQLFPWIDGGHSGNTWGHAVGFAMRLVRNMGHLL
jgi:hypothetical protein